MKYKTKEVQKPFPQGLKTDRLRLEFITDSKTNNILSFKATILGEVTKVKEWPIKKGGLIATFKKVEDFINKNLDLTKISRKKRTKKS